MTKWPAAGFAIFVPREPKDAFLTAAPRPLITLLTDFGTRDAYVGSLKDVILSLALKIRRSSSREARHCSR